MKRIFLICTERSGSNLITQIFNNHSKCCGTSPNHLYRFFLPIIHKYPDLKNNINWQKAIDDVVKAHNLKLGDDWVTKMSISIANPVDEKSFRTIRDGPYLKERKVVDTILFPTVNSAYSAATRLAKYWEYSNYRGLPVYKEVFGLED